MTSPLKLEGNNHRDGNEKMATYKLFDMGYTLILLQAFYCWHCIHIIKVSVLLNTTLSLELTYNLLICVGAVGAEWCHV